MISNKTLQKAILEVSKDLDIPDEVVEVAYREYWNWVKDTLENTPVNEDMDKEEFEKLHTSINIPSLGKFYAKYSRATFLNSRYKQYEKKQNEDSGGDSTIYNDASNS